MLRDCLPMAVPEQIHSRERQHQHDGPVSVVYVDEVTVGCRASLIA